MYPALEANEAALEGHLALKGKGREAFKTPKDEDRHARSDEEMAKEAEWLAGFFR